MKKIILSDFKQLKRVPSLAMFFVALTASAMSHAQSTPTLIITNQPLPAELRQNTYSKPYRAPNVSPQQILNTINNDAGQATVVTRKMESLRSEFISLQGRISDLSQKLRTVERASQQLAANYYADVGTISTQLQSGTTPGNPRLVGHLDSAQANLQQLGENLTKYNSLSVDIADIASVSTLLLTETRAAYGLSGALETDHVQLAELEDSLNNAIVIIDRLQSNVNDDISRTSAYLATEQNNIRTLSLAVTNGDFYGRALTDRPFSSAPVSQTPQNVSFSTPSAPPSNTNPRPLVKIRFDKPDVSYEQPVYSALNEAMQKFPNSRFELIAVEPTVGNAAQIAIESTRARRNAEKVLRSISQMGLDTNKIDMTTSQSSSATSSEVHIYLK